ncbi:UNVERIFIED_CONTAM: hypothetical protein Sindi_0379600 [Sesamum indicum]
MEVNCNFSTTNRQQQKIEKSRYLHREYYYLDTIYSVECSHLDIVKAGSYVCGIKSLLEVLELYCGKGMHVVMQQVSSPARFMLGEKTYLPHVLIPSDASVEVILVISSTGVRLVEWQWHRLHCSELPDVVQVLIF